MIRLVELRPDSPFYRSDEPMFVLASLKLHALSSAGSLREAFRGAFTVFSFPWGYGNLLFSFLTLQATDWMGRPLSDFAILAPFALLGGLNVIAVFLLATKLFSRRVGHASALAVALLPAHIALSRTNLQHVLALTLMMFTLLAFLRYVQTGARSHALLLSFCLALYLPTDLTAPGSLLLLALWGVLSLEGSLRARIKRLLRLLLRPAVLVAPLLAVLPIAMVQLAVLTKGQFSSGFFGHYLDSKLKPGFYWSALLGGLWENSRPALAPLVVLGAFQTVMSFVKGGQPLLLGVWVLAFASGLVFLLNPTGTTFSSYLLPLMTPLAMLGSLAVSDLLCKLGRKLSPRAAWVSAGVLLSAWVVWATVVIPPRIYERSVFGLRSDPVGLWGGVVYPNTGVKTAGYWIRTNTPPEAVVLSDVRNFVGKYYFHRPTVLSIDPRIANGTADPLWLQIKILALTAEFVPTAQTRGYLTGFHRVLTVTRGGQEVFFVYLRDPQLPATVATEQFDRLFDREFGRVAALEYPCLWEDETVRPRSTCL